MNLQLVVYDAAFAGGLMGWLFFIRLRKVDPKSAWFFAGIGTSSGWMGLLAVFFK